MDSVHIMYNITQQTYRTGARRLDRSLLCTLRMNNCINSGWGQLLDSGQTYIHMLYFSRRTLRPIPQPTRLYQRKFISAIGRVFFFLIQTRAGTPVMNASSFLFEACLTPTCQSLWYPGGVSALCSMGENNIWITAGIIGQTGGGVTTERQILGEGIELQRLHTIIKILHCSRI